MPHPDRQAAEALLERLYELLTDAGLRATLTAAAVESVSLRGAIQQVGGALCEMADDCEAERDRRARNEEDQTNAAVARAEIDDGVRNHDA